MWCPKNFQRPVKWVLGFFSGVKLPGPTSEHPFFHSAEVEYTQNSNCVPPFCSCLALTFSEKRYVLYLPRQHCTVFFLCCSSVLIQAMASALPVFRGNWVQRVEDVFITPKPIVEGQRNLFLSGTWLKTCPVFVTYFMYFGIMFILLLKLWFSSDIINLQRWWRLCSSW